jgi:hypothetical protein
MPAGAKLEVRVHPQASHGDAAHSSQTLQFARFAVEPEMLIPTVSAGMEERDALVFIRVLTRGCGGLVQVAGIAGESEVLQRILTACCAGRDVLHFKCEVEDLLRRAAVLAPFPGAFRHGRVPRVRDFTSGRV